MCKHLCPVCGMYEFPEKDSFDVCQVCGWEDDLLQLVEPDFAGGANRLSLNQFREKWEAKPNGKKNRIVRKIRRKK
ncbi:MAG TPA: hypothetical protein H9687_00510 [Firmicutes bacterium]|nr:hypothetical protein [Bacillota bacterium]